MEKTIGVYEAKTHFSRLIDTVAQGERIVITRNGAPVAELRPIEPERTSPEELVRQFKAFQRSQTKNAGELRRRGESLRDLAHQGHSR